MFFHVPFLEASLSEEFTRRLVQQVLLLQPVFPKHLFSLPFLKVGLLHFNVLYTSAS